MRTGKEILLASKEFTQENRFKSWFETIITLLPTALLFTITLLDYFPIVIRIISGLICGLLYVRLFVIYHDYQHRAILQNSFLAKWLMRAIGVYLLAPETIWKRSHEHHHNNNSKLTLSGIGSYPTICKDRYQKLTKTQKRIYLMNRHPFTVLFGYVTLFVYWLNLKSFAQSPLRHLDSLFALVFHIGAGALIWYYFGGIAFSIAWIMPFLLAFGTGSYLFYAQHNFPGAKFSENHDWTYVNAALHSTSFMPMNPIMQWFTANIGYHHVHHVNSRIPFYRLREAFEAMPELHHAPTTSLSPIEMLRCFDLKLWDPEREEMITLKQAKVKAEVISPEPELVA